LGGGPAGARHLAGAGGLAVSRKNRHAIAVARMFVAHPPADRPAAPALLVKDDFITSDQGSKYVYVLGKGNVWRPKR